jgi:hypothetical protein
MRHVIYRHITLNGPAKTLFLRLTKSKFRNLFDEMELHYYNNYRVVQLELVIKVINYI